eukprot:gnl/TRDRNA2_/TRDRNA2_159250_c0_seq2.p1 gnl/TRDRNA2_/TRDRNA2_159250_c0~~gnl/TRDRNA2_/TRDRNA2_159250_c0_seq2.p1  ORF type:complete len:212 (+),score=31.95 gnl/TRDRNA2_/TRDRNA2_159250_c0_seq2:131-766(+)
MAAVASTAGAASKVHTGTIKSWNQENGWGHISCEELMQVHGRDVFFLESELQFATAAKGCPVQFTVMEAEQGLFAQKVRLASGATSQNTDYKGTCKSWNKVKGWGHIECADTYALYQKDMFVMRSSVCGGELWTGAEVLFSVDQGKKGVEAVNVRPKQEHDGNWSQKGGSSNMWTDPGWGPQWDEWGGSYGGGWMNSGKGKGKSKWNNMPY